MCLCIGASSGWSGMKRAIFQWVDYSTMSIYFIHVPSRKTDLDVLASTWDHPSSCYSMYTALATTGLESHRVSFTYHNNKGFPFHRNRAYYSVLCVKSKLYSCIVIETTLGIYELMDKFVPKIALHVILLLLLRKKPAEEGDCSYNGSRRPSGPLYANELKIFIFRIFFTFFPPLWKRGGN